jgi:CheY-like chemotaxis protein
MNGTQVWPDGLTVRLDLADGLPLVNGASAQLLRVISNLVSNARESMHDLGTVTIKTEHVYLDRPLGRHERIEVGEYVKLTVSDTGSGVPEEIRDKIFDAFFTTKSSRKRRGAGLGLSIVQTIVEDHRGYVDVESEEGVGSSFAIYLPACQDFVEAQPANELRGGTETVLVVDDDERQREVVREVLSRLGYRVAAVNSGEDALELLKEVRADLLILDMVMPAGIDGATTFLEALKIRPSQRAIMMSGFSESERARFALQLGVGAYLRKPVRMDALARAVRTELDR